MAPSCALDDAGLRLQLERYWQAGAGARLIDRTPRSLVVDLDEQVDTQLVDETIAIERLCCPFFTLEWELERRRLTVAVSQAEHGVRSMSLGYFNCLSDKFEVGNLNPARATPALAHARAR
jgi:hypothetical protein